MLPAILAVFLVLLVVMYRKSVAKWNRAPPGPPGIPLFGNLRQLASGKSPVDKIQEWKSDYGDIVGLQMGQYRLVILNGYDTLKDAFNMWEFSGRSLLKPFQVITGGEKHGLILSEGQSWTEQRRFALRNLRDFGFGKKSMESLIHEDITDLIENFKELEGKPLIPHRKFSTAVFRSLWNIMAGERFTYGDPRFQTVLDDLHSVISSINVSGPAFFMPWVATLFPERTGWNKFISSMERAKDLVRKYLKEHQKTFQPDNIRDLIDAFLKEIKSTHDPSSSFYKETGEKNLLVGMLNLFNAGAETTSGTMVWTLLYLIKHPAVQEKIYQEISTVIGKSQMPSLDHRESCVYTWAVMEEVLRISSLAPIGVFHNTMEDVTYKNYLIPKDTLVWGNLYGVHHDKKIWGDPENFRPERFLLKNSDGQGYQKNTHAGPVIPFGVGKRACLGEVLARNNYFLYLTSLIQKFEITAGNGNASSLEVEATTGLTRTAKEFSIIIRERE